MQKPFDEMEDVGYQGGNAITCVEMHTTGEPTRIVCSGFPKLQGTLLEQRAEARKQHDHLRRRIMLEPRGHEAMYGAVLCQETELTMTGQADIGVLFMHNHGFSTMCGHATIALGRFLVDTHNSTIFPNRRKLRFDPVTQKTSISLHAPCGVLRISVPTKPDGRTSDASKPVSLLSMPSFATALQVQVEIPQSLRWPKLGSRTSVFADFSYGGTFYLIISAKELGFPNGLKEVSLDVTDVATKKLKEAVMGDERLRTQVLHSVHPDLCFLYSVMIVDNELGVKVPGSDGAESGLCFFEGQQIDRSPTGGCVAARVALAYAKGLLKVGQSWTYHSVVSNMTGGRGAFIGSVKEVVPDVEAKGLPEKSVTVEVSGQAFYTGMHVFTVENEDGISDGFAFASLFNANSYL